MVRKINVKLIQELRDVGLSRSMIASTRHISRHSVSKVFNIADGKGISYDDVRALEEPEVYRLFIRQSSRARPCMETLIRMYEYTDKRPLNSGTMAELSGCRFVDDCGSIVFRGYTSSGKTFLECALAKEACRQLHKVRYIRLSELLSEYADKSLVPGGKAKVCNKFELSERRFDTTSTIFCTLYMQEDWVKHLGGGAYAESIVERFAYNVTWIETGYENLKCQIGTSKIIDQEKSDDRRCKYRNNACFC